MSWLLYVIWCFVLVRLRACCSEAEQAIAEATSIRDKEAAEFAKVITSDEIEPRKGK